MTILSSLTQYFSWIDVKSSFFLTLCLFLLSFSEPSCSMEQIRLMRDVDDALLVMQKWLSTFHEVAIWEWNHGKRCLYDEQEVRSRQTMIEMFVSRGVPRDFATDLTCSMIQAGRIIHNEDFKAWSATGQRDFVSVIDLERELRPYHKELWESLLEKLSPLIPHLTDHCCCQMVGIPLLSKRRCDEIPAAAWREVLSPFWKLESGESQ